MKPRILPPDVELFLNQTNPHIDPKEKEPKKPNPHAQFQPAKVEADKAPEKKEETTKKTQLHIAKL